MILFFRKMRSGFCHIPFLGICYMLLGLCCFAVLQAPGIAEEFLPEGMELNDMVVTGTRTAVPLSEVGRSLTVISREDIKQLPVDNLPDLLETVGGVDVRQRGGLGIQADVSVRGGSFEQTLILVDGINMSDAQTGHHNMNLPVTLEDIDHIEILKGPAAGVYGHNAMTGVINIITRDGTRNRASAAIAYGSHDYVRADGGVEGKTGALSNRLSVSRRTSPGYLSHEETDFDVKTLTYKGTVESGAHVFHLGLGYLENDFGAYRFYSDAFPSQREETRTLLAYADGDLHLSSCTLSPRVFWRQNKDVFDIDIGGNWSENSHRTNTAGFQVNAEFETGLGKTAVGGEMAGEDIDSSNLGDHTRNRYGLFFEHRFSLGRNLSIGAMTSAVRYSDWGLKFWPGADLNIRLPRGFNVFASAARSYRVPTYTELYYSTPANQGNPDLVPEKARTYEMGLRRTEKGLSMEACIFFRDADDLIDWTRTPGDAVWQVRNIAQSRTRGIEAGLDLYPGLVFHRFHRTVVRLSYTWLDSDRDTGKYESKYILDHLRHQAEATMSLSWTDRLSQTFVARYEKRMNEDAHVVADTRLSYAGRRYDLFCDVTNLFDEDYIDNGFAPAPGRWIVVGIRIHHDM